MKTLTSFFCALYLSGPEESVGDGEKDRYQVVYPSYYRHYIRRQIRRDDQIEQRCQRTDHYVQLIFVGRLHGIVESTLPVVVLVNQVHRFHALVEVHVRTYHNESPEDVP